ncbi:MAG: hypothetical protein ACXWF8_02080 [Methylobacter sp.]
MYKHLQLVKESLVPPPANHLSDMDIIMRQAVLMEDGSAVLKGLKTGDTLDTLAGLVKLAYSALTSVAMQNGEAADRPVTWRHDGFVISLMRRLSDQINCCASGNTEDYAELYRLCAQLAGSFINADFDKAFRVIHDSKTSKSTKTPDLSDCLFE